MNIKDYYEKKKEIEDIIAFNEKIHCPHVAARWRRELDKLERESLKEYGGNGYGGTTDD